MPANFNILNLSEENIASETVVGQANDSTLARNSIHPLYGNIFQQQVAIQRGHLVGMRTDGKFYNAYAGTGANQVMAHGFSIAEVPNGGPLDVMRKELELKLDAPVSGAFPGAVAYLSDVTPGYPTATKPTAVGTIVQVIGFFIATDVIKYRLGLDVKVN